MNAIVTKISGFLLLCCFCLEMAQAQWVGGPASTGGAVWTSMDVDSEGTPYIAYDVDGMRVSKRVDGEWVPVGEPFKTVWNPNKSIFPYVKVDRNNVPYIAFQDNEQGDQMVVKRFNGTEWETVGSGATATSHAVRYTYINFDYKNVPHVFYRDITDNKGRVIRLEDGEWAQLGPNVSGKASDFASIVFGKDNVPYVGYHDEENGWGATVKKFNGTDWEVVGTASFAAPGGAQVNNPFLAMDNNDVPYVLFNDVTLDKATVMKFDGSAWVPVGNAGFSSGSIKANEGTNKLFFGLDNRPYVNFNDGGLGRGVFMAFDGTAWSLVGGEPATPNGTGHYGAAMDRENGILYYSYRNGSDGGRRAFVYEFKVGPQISVSPKDVTIVEGGSVALKGVAAGSGLAYQWQVNKNDGSGFVDIAEDATYSNTQTSQLKITFATNAMDGYRYRMVAIGENGASATKSAVLTVIPSDFCYPAAIVVAPVDVVACPETAATFSVDATGTDLVYQWQISLNGTDFSNIIDDTIYGGATTATLSVDAVESAMHGNLYRVVVSACEASVVSDNVVLNVYNQPAIVNEPQTPDWLCSGASTVLEVVAEGDGLSFQWELDKGNGFETLTDEGNYEGATTARLAIADVTADMNGYVYRVVTSGTCEPELTSQTVVLPVYQPLIGGVIEGEQVICANAVASELLTAEEANGEAGPYQYQWQLSKDAASWEDIAGANMLNYAPGEIAESIYLRRMVVSSTDCGTMAYSNTVLVRVTDELTAGEIAGDQNIRYGSIPQSFISKEEGFGGEGVIYQWELSVNEQDFEPILNATAKDYNPPSPVYQTTHYRRRAIAALGCGTTLSNTLKVVVYQYDFELSKIPNVLFPNGNIKNRTWGVSHIGLGGPVKVRIFNRNGQTIFASDNAENEWDGTHNGDPVPPGNYFYSIENQEGKQLSGTVKVIY